MKLKVCGMKYVNNIQEVVNLQPDYLGFIFYEKSKRNFEGIIPELPKSVKKTGVFVNEHSEIVISLVEEYQLDALQLHGDESVMYIKELQSQLAERNALFIEENKHQKKKKNKHDIVKDKIEIIKVFGIKDAFDFDVLKPYLEVVDYFLFDAKPSIGDKSQKGGLNKVFDWSLLKEWTGPKYILSGGLNIKNVEDAIKMTNAVVIDVSSGVESEPGIKNEEMIKNFIDTTKSAFGKRDE